MTGKTDRRVWKCFEKLPAPVQKLALGLREGDIIAWFWIGTHEEYNRFRY